MNLRVEDTRAREEDRMIKNEVRESRSEVPRKEWVEPKLVVYGDMTALTQQCAPPSCKPKVLGLGDDFASNISTV
ncbi:MAG: hypothetical protein DWQ47_03550 [Acidobacteria bacterium]|nr:MAG: hypothetical protein DWQ32_07100 [Acidobacteriota bacterium]REK01476.1 MAG: hypothetical protein DWQ38_03535 [Acidobacteriota bacterium]REK14432.1 MAG: hypothetical protein DWQ43_12790 [Acidobacteriota bacterium]REK45147.1 MAG: hypothetical protein DWQ47_03550 [Acidobacteriota bacterium]